MLQLFVRWGADGEGYDSVDLVNSGNGHTMQTSGVICNNKDRIYGYCMGVVAVFKTLVFLKSVGVDLNSFVTERKMSWCFHGRHHTANTIRQD